MENLVEACKFLAAFNNLCSALYADGLIADRAIIDIYCECNLVVFLNVLQFPRFKVSGKIKRAGRKYVRHWHYMGNVVMASCNPARFIGKQELFFGLGKGDQLRKIRALSYL